MKKIFLFLTIATLAITSCRKDDETTIIEEVSIETQNTYDDEAIQKFLKDNYFDSRGNVVAFSSTITTDDNEKPLLDYSPIKLSSGVVYINKYTPTNGKAVVSTDRLRLMHNTLTYIATKDDKNVVGFSSGVSFRNTIAGTGTPELDPAYFYIKNSILKSDVYKDKTRSFFELEGFQEAITKFQSCEIADSENYNLQGVIIVPSRAAYARDDHFPFSSYSLKNRSFVFNFQIYKTETRTTAND